MSHFFYRRGIIDTKSVVQWQKNDRGCTRMEQGRPLKYRSKKKLEMAIDDYFMCCDATERPYTMSGLAVHLGIDRTTLINYGKREQFFNTIKKARDKVENYAEEQLFLNSHTAGVIFNLKNNFGWRDKAEIDANTEEETVANKLTEVFGFAQQETKGSS